MDKKLAFIKVLDTINKTEFELTFIIITIIRQVKCESFWILIKLDDRFQFDSFRQQFKLLDLLVQKVGTARTDR